MSLRDDLEGAPLLPLPEDFDFDSLYEDLEQEMALEVDEESDLESEVAPEEDPISDDETLSEDSWFVGTRNYPLHRQAPPAEQTLRQQVMSEDLELRIGGGGARAYYVPGFYHALVKYGGLDISKVKIFKGISIGCSVAASLALGLTPKEFAEFCLQMDGARLKDITKHSGLALFGSFLEGASYNFQHRRWLGRMFGKLLYALGRLCRYIAKGLPWNKRWSLYQGEGLKRLLEHLFEERTGLKRPTFQELKDRDVNLQVVTNIVCCRSRKVWSAESDPDQDVVEVMLASMSIPGVFPPFYDRDGHLHSDGGIRDNVPPKDPNTPYSRSRVFLFRSKEEETLAQKGRLHRAIHHFFDFFKHIFQIGYFLSVNPLHPTDEDRAGYIRATDVGVGDFDAPVDARIKAFREGFVSGMEFLKEQTEKARRRYPQQALIAEERQITREMRRAHSAHLVLNEQDHQRERSLTLSYSGRREYSRALERISRHCTRRSLKSLMEDTTDGHFQIKMSLRRNITLR